MAKNKIIALGASAGGIEAISKVISTLPEDIPAPLFVVLHSGPESPGLLDEIFSRAGRLKAKYAENGEAFSPGTIYIAPADHHLIIKDSRTLLSRGPRENRSRPALDPLFRSAGAAYDSQTIGVVLSGMLDDGTAGLFSLKRCGGITCVQDPADAAYPDMPRNALENVEVDYVLPAAELGPVLDRLAREHGENHTPIPEDIVKEARIAELGVSNINMMEKMGNKAPFVCPECGGVLWEMRQDPIQRYRCNVGHAYTIASLISSQDEAIENALWAAIRSLEERANMLMRLVTYNRERGRAKVTVEWEREAEDSRRNAQRIRELLLRKLPEAEPITAI
ncbi:MAG TPA: chemotaxis protein CheB [Dissulfurispiraceae bacterium]